MRYPIKEGTGIPYGVPSGIKVDKEGNMIGKALEVEKPKPEEKKK